MFWHSAASNNAIDNLLDQPDVKLIDILGQDEVLMEIRGMNKKLIEFLTRPESMHELLDLITTVPSADIPIPLQYKFPNTACEVLTSDISFAEKIAAEPAMMKKLFHFFRDFAPPLNPLLASYVCRVLTEMIVRKLDQNWYSYQLNLIQVMGYLQSEPGLLDWLLKHLETSSVCDFFHKLVMNVEGQDMRNSLYEWLEVREQFVMKLVNMMSRRHNREVHMNVCRLVSELLFALQDDSSSASQDRSIDSEPFLLALKSPTTVESLFDVILGDNTRSQSSIVYGLDLLLAVMGIAKKPTKPNSKIDTTYDSNQDVMLPESVRIILLIKFPTLLRFLEIPPSTREPIDLSNGTLYEPLGSERLAIVKFVAHIITLHDPVLNSALIKSRTLKKALDLFWEFPWNNFLHHYVCQIVIQITKITLFSDECARFLLVEYAFLEKIMECFDNQCLNVGFMGHLARMTAAIIDSLESNETMQRAFSELTVMEKFKEFQETKWKDYNLRSTQLLAGAPLPSSGVPIASHHNYESDPGVSWDSSSGAALNTDGDNADDNFFEASSADFGDADRYDDEKSKSIFEMFCFDRNNTAGDDDEDASFGRTEDGGGISLPFQSEQPDDADDGFEWRNPNIFFKQLEDNEEMFGQLALNGTLGETAGDNISTASFIANPWADQESVQVDTTDPWAAFDMANDNTTKASDGVLTENSSEDNWAKFDQSFPISSTDMDSFADFTSATNFFSDSNTAMANDDEPPKLTEEPPKLTEEPLKLTEEPTKLTEEPPKLTEEPPKLTEEPNTTSSSNNATNSSSPSAEEANKPNL